MDELTDKLKAMLQQATRLGDLQADAIVNEMCKVRDAKRCMRIAIRMLESGRANEALMLLKSWVREDGQVQDRRSDPG